MKKYALLLICLSLQFVQIGNVYGSKKRIHNFPLYNLERKRSLLYEVLQSLPADGYLILNFTSIYCKPCRKEIPELVGLQKAYKKRVSLWYIYSEYNKTDVTANARETGIPDMNTVCMDLFGTIKRELNIRSVPYTIIVNKNKKIISIMNGYKPGNLKKITGILRGTN
ncbi:MAG: TlpA family protein disulfide reductase [bacterium]|nr:TlpA family protein disulfide reductase [bacterium]